MELLGVYSNQRRTQARLQALRDLPTAAQVIEQATEEKLSFKAALERLLTMEVTTAEARRMTGRLRLACQPSPASPDDCDYDTQPGVDHKLINKLGTCSYLHNATNVLLIDPPSVGKTHLAIGFARKAAHVGSRTYVTTAAELAARCHRAAIEGRWATTMRLFNGPTLLVIDELGYLPLQAEGAAALFQVAKQRYLKTSIIITSNRGVGGWGEILGDATMAAAMPDRPLHRSVVMNLYGDSCRLRDYQARNETLRRTKIANPLP